MASKRDPLFLYGARSRQLARKEDEGCGTSSLSEARNINNLPEGSNLAEETDDTHFKQEPHFLDTISSQLSTGSYSEEDKGFVVGDLISCSESNRNSGFTFVPHTHPSHMGSEGREETYSSDSFNVDKEARIQDFGSLDADNINELDQEALSHCPSSLFTKSGARPINGSMFQQGLKRDGCKDGFPELKEHCKSSGSPDLFLSASQESQNVDRERIDKDRVGSYLPESPRLKGCGDRDTYQGMGMRKEINCDKRGFNGWCASSELEVTSGHEGKVSRNEEKSKQSLGIDMEDNSSKGIDEGTAHGESSYQDNSYESLSKFGNYCEHDSLPDDPFTSDPNSLESPNPLSKGNPFRNASESSRCQIVSRIGLFQRASKVPSLQKASKESNPFVSSKDYNPFKPSSGYSFDCGTLSQANYICTLENSSQITAVSDKPSKKKSMGNAFPRASQEPDIFTAACHESFHALSQFSLSSTQGSLDSVHKDQEVHDYLDDLQQTLGPPSAPDEVDEKSALSCDKSNPKNVGVVENGIKEKSYGGGTEKKIPAFKPVFGKSKIVKPPSKPESVKPPSAKPGVKAISSKPVSAKPPPPSLEGVQPLSSNPENIKFQGDNPQEESGKKAVTQKDVVPEKQSEKVATLTKTVENEGVNGSSGDQKGSCIPKEKENAPVKPTFAKVCAAKKNRILKVLESPLRKAQLLSEDKGKKPVAEGNGVAKKVTKGKSEKPKKKSKEEVTNESKGQTNGKVSKKLATEIKTKGPMVKGGKQQPSEKRKSIAQEQKLEGKRENKGTKILKQKPGKNVEVQSEFACEKSVDDKEKNKSKPTPVKHPKKLLGNSKKLGRSESEVVDKQVLDDVNHKGCHKSTSENENEISNEDCYKSTFENEIEIGNDCSTSMFKNEKKIEKEKIGQSSVSDRGSENGSLTMEYHNGRENRRIEVMSGNRMKPISTENKNEDLGIQNGQEEPIDQRKSIQNKDEIRDSKCPEESHEPSNLCGSLSLTSIKGITMSKAPTEICTKEKHLGVKKKNDSCSSKKPTTSKPTVSLNDDLWNEIFDAVISSGNCLGTGNVDSSKDTLGRPSTDKEEIHPDFFKQNYSNKKVAIDRVKWQENVTKRSKGSHGEKSKKGRTGNSTMNHSAKTVDIKTRLLELQEETDAPVWVQCSTCDKWRVLRDVLDPSEVPEIWNCSMNSDPAERSCDVCEEDWYKENQDFFVYNKFTVGSVVWATLTRHYWWPAMVDDDPDTETFFWLNDFSDIPNYYHVTFFGKPVERAWTLSQDIVKFHATDRVEDFLRKKQKLPRCSGRVLEQLHFAYSQAKSALRMNLKDRRYKFCFATRYKGPWESSRFSEMGNREKTSRNRNNWNEVHNHSNGVSDSSDSSVSDDSRCDELDVSDFREGRLLSSTPVKRKKGGSNSSSKSITCSPQKRKFNNTDDSPSPSKKPCSEDEDTRKSCSQNSSASKISLKANTEDENFHRRGTSLTEKGNEIDCDVVHLQKNDNFSGGSSNSALEKGQEELCVLSQNECSNKENIPP